MFPEKAFNCHLNMTKSDKYGTGLGSLAVNGQYGNSTLP